MFSPESTIPSWLVYYPNRQECVLNGAWKDAVKHRSPASFHVAKGVRSALTRQLGLMEPKTPYCVYFSGNDCLGIGASFRKGFPDVTPEEKEELYAV